MEAAHKKVKAGMLKWESETPLVSCLIGSATSITAAAAVVAGQLGPT